MAAGICCKHDTSYIRSQSCPQGNPHQGCFKMPAIVMRCSGDGSSICSRRFWQAGDAFR